MSRPWLLSLPLLLLSLTSAQRFPWGSARYQNLYGPGGGEAPMSQVLSRLALGSLKFLVDGDESLAQELRDYTPRQGQQFDFIVVGAGSAGATIASRLSELPDVKVLLIEAGGQENLLMDVPVLVNLLQLSDQLNWKYQTEPSNAYCRGMRGNRCNWPRGKVMGGSSVLNYMIATRGNPRDYDGWAAAGNVGWSYEEVLPYFKKLEQIGVEELARDHLMHNTDGPVHIEYPPYHTPVARGFLEAGRELGYPIIDYNGHRQDIGFSFIQATIKNGTRVSTNRAYLYPAHSRPNLFVSKLSHVSRVLLSENKRAYGVEFSKPGHGTIRVRAKKEVILSAGAINSPQILMLSGIGPAAHLRDKGIKLVQELPVGKNLMDHIAYGGHVFLVDQPVSITAADMWNPMKPYIGDFLMHRKGPLTVPGGCEALAFVNVDQPERRDVLPNIELLFVGGSVVSDPAYQLTFGISQEHWSKQFAKMTGRYSWTAMPMLLQPKSRGEILLRSPNPKDKPVIRANYFDHPDDLRVMVKGIRAAIEVGNTKAMRRFNSKLYDHHIPGCEQHAYDSDEYWACAARTYTFTIYHYSGTCKMAPEEDPTSVVNPRLQVKGIKGLRVADASIMPEIMSGHPNIPIIMIGEKLADMVKEDWGYKTKN